MNPRSSNPISEGDIRRYAPSVLLVGRLAAREMLVTAEAITAIR